MSIRAVAMVSGSSLRSTPGSQAEIHGVSLHITHACLIGSMNGVPARRSPASGGAHPMALGGQAVTQSPHRVHEARNCPSATAPGGR